MPEESMIRYCAPTLAGIKTGSLFNTKCDNDQELLQWVRKLNHELREKGLRVLPMGGKANNTLLYVYRPAHLNRDLQDHTACDLLQECGYCNRSPEQCVVHLAKRIRECEEFPHEIGLFLGYPPEDVAGFIENKAQNSKYSGLWKVYGNVEQAQRLFASFKSCTDVYMKNWNAGMTLKHLAVGE